jgi:hypothetical protein
MRVRFRLAQILARHHQSGHGLITRIKNATSIERHKVSSLLLDEEDKISLRHLGEICRFLIEQCNVDPRDLPGALFEIEPSHFLSLLRSTPTLRTCFGVRLRSEARPDSPWASGTDSLLHGKLLELLLRPDSPRPSAEGNGAPASVIAGHAPHLRIRHFHQEQVYAASSARLRDPKERDDEFNLLKHDAERVYQALHAPAGGDSAAADGEAIGHVALLLGTLKSNPACELATARTFGAVPWATHGRSTRSSAGTADLVATAAERAVPFFIRYRDSSNSTMVDPLIPSCYAGDRLCRDKVKCGKNSTVPGIYYETEGGVWECAPWTDDRDAALVLYDYDRINGDVEVTLGGFSSRATLLLADHLEQIADALIPEPLDGQNSKAPGWVTNQRAVGAFVIEFRIDTAATAERGDRMPTAAKAPDIIPLDANVLGRRLELD